MDQEIKRLDRKEKLHEAALVEQMDNVERRIDYEALKNKKIQTQIDVEQGKIQKIKDKYKDRKVTMEVKLQDMEKDLKFA